MNKPVLLFALACCLLPPGAHAARNKDKRSAPITPSVAVQLAEPALAAKIAHFDRLAGPMGHPRLFKGRPDYAGIVAATGAERALALRTLVDTLKRHRASAIGPALKAHIEHHDQSSWWQQERLLEGAAEAAFAWYATREDWLLDETIARLRLFGPALLQRGCQGDVAETRDYVWYFALAYDFTHASLPAPERQLVADVIASCANAALAGVPATLRQHPDNGIAFNALGKLVGALLIVRGDMPAAEGLLRTALPAYVAALSPWGGEDGGFSNGSSYALWDAGESLLAWDLVERVLGVPLYRKPWLANLPRFLAYTLPPGTPAGAFGDGAEAERGEEWARLGKAVAARSATPLARWYAARLKGEDYARLQILLSPPAAPGSSALPPSAPDAAVFTSVGVAAMHSALDDPGRTTVLFRSSPFGSVNHAHADQNAFVLYARGRVLAMDSGVYDSYNSPHWRQWYKQTRAHNAVTFDGGQGQPLGALGQSDTVHAGRIARFSHSADYDIAVGEAERAYGGDIRLARRTLVFLRPSTLIVVDQLRSDAPHTWEWNVHTPAPLAGPPDDFRVELDGVALCGSVAAPGPLVASRDSAYTPAPAKPGGPHYGTRFAYAEAQRDGLMVAVLRVGCGGARPRIRVHGENASVNLGGRSIKVAPARVTLR